MNFLRRLMFHHAAGDAESPARRAADDWRAWIYPTLLGAAGAGFVIVPALISTGWHFSVPIDDAFIHAQFARQITAGRFFTWTVGGGYSLGETSPLYPFVLAVGYLAGFRDHWIMAFALIVNLAGLILALRVLMAFAVGRRPAPAREAWLAWAAPFVLVFNGSLLYAICNGMEVGLSLGLLALFLAAMWKDWSESMAVGPRVSTIALGALVGLTRPDYLVLIAPLMLVALLLRIRDWKWRGWLRAAIVPLPLLAIFGINWLATGLVLPNSLALKSLWASPRLCDAEKWTRFLDQILGAPGGYLIDVYGELATALMLGATLALAIPAAWRAWRHDRRRAGFHLVLIGSALLYSLVPAALVSAGKNEFRFYHGAFLFAAVGWVGLVGLALAAGEELKRDLRFPVVGVCVFALGALVVGGAACLPGYRQSFIDAWDHIWADQAAMGKLIHERAAADPTFRGTILTHEAGAPVYFSQAKYLDLVGLCSNPERGVRMTEYCATDDTLFFEAVERLPEEQWPDYSLVFQIGSGSFARLPFAAEVIVPNLMTKPNWNSPWRHWLGLFRFPKELLRTGHVPTPRVVPEGWSIRDRLDVADLADERAHAFAIEWPREYVVRQADFRLSATGGVNVGDCGRRINVPAQWRFSNLTSDAPAVVLWRVWSNRPTCYRLRIEGMEAREIAIEEQPEMTVEELVSLPRLTGDAIEMRLEPIEGWAQVFHVWILQPVAAPSALAR